MTEEEYKKAYNDGVKYGFELAIVNLVDLRMRTAGTEENIDDIIENDKDINYLKQMHKNL